MLDRIHQKIRDIYELVGSLDPHIIAKRKRLIIEYTYELPKEVLGMFYPVGAKGVIYLRPDLQEEQERFVLFHELFHFLMGHRGLFATTNDNMYNPNWVRLSKQEHEAHMGAACAILDGYEFYEGQTSLDISKETGCPVKIVERWVQLVGLKIN